MVAKSYQSFEVVSDVYMIGTRNYIKVRNPKTGHDRQVRWYTEQEYYKLYPTDKPQEVPQEKRNVKDILGFTKGYITIFKGDINAHLDWFKVSICRYARYWGWYVISTETIPDDTPKELETFQLPWQAVGNDDGTLKSEKEVREAVDGILYADPGSEFQSEIGQRLDLTLTVRKALPLEGKFGLSTLHEMNDDAGNIYIWTTSARTLKEGEIYHLRGTVKDHRVYHNCKQTVLTNCRLVKN